MAVIKQQLKIKRNDLQPYFRFSIPDAVGLDQATFVCTMIDTKKKEVKIDRRSAGCVITDPTKNECEYRWQLGDTDTAGTFSIEFEFTPTAGGKFTVPIDPGATVLIIADLDEE